MYWVSVLCSTVVMATERDKQTNSWMGSQIGKEMWTMSGRRE